ncbi:leukocyte receptor cluster member 9 [Trichosurus vulpecula]|uniref:leukocyte receptor cluster member 9 n=1 Tax=Trichosurus vulpecula TaxID=9337 RepID=UPI00186AC75E|nr:leukocyte receptor cluster member 9 [Trichosurus vulpecula]
MEEEEAPTPICRFYVEGRCHFGARCRLAHPGAEAGAAARAEPQPGPPSGPEGKKPSMKTAQAVIDRIRWDPHLDPADFSVGYLDRFRGVQEEPFTAFCWDEELAALGPGVLAVPQHRIRYFLHRGRLVWDRATRTDFVFGSAAGRGTTILDGLAAAGAPGIEPDTPREDGGPAAASGAPEEGVRPGMETGAPEESGLGMETGAPEEGSRPGTEPSKTWGRTPHGSTEPEPEPKGSPEGRQELRPTHFVALMITDLELREAVARTQARLIEAEASIGSSLVGLETLHLTLVLLRLAGPGEVATAARALRCLVREPSFHYPRAVHFQNLACLDHRVIYSVPKPGLQGLAQALAQQLKAEGLQVLEPSGEELAPHLTLAKLPKGTSGHLSLPEAEAELGSQLVEGFQLCSVGRLQEAGGCYSVLAQVPLGP